MSDADFNYAARIRALMKERGVSMRALSDETGVPYRTVQNYLTGTVSIPASFVAQIASFFKIEADYLLFNSVDIDIQSLCSAVELVLAEVLPVLAPGSHDEVTFLPGMKPSPREAYGHYMAGHVAESLRNLYVASRIRRALKDGMVNRDDAFEVHLARTVRKVGQ